MTIELVLLYLTNELVRLYGECRVGQQPRCLQRYKLDAPLLAAGLLTLDISTLHNYNVSLQLNILP